MSTPELTEQTRARLERELNEFIRECRAHGFVVSVETIPLNPPAMGNYAVAGEVRLAKELYRRGE